MLGTRGQHANHSAVRSLCWLARYLKSSGSFLTHLLYRSSSKVPGIVVRYSRNWNFIDRFREKYFDIKFNENPLGGSRVVPSGRLDGQID
jgi:hypothetical protein